MALSTARSADGSKVCAGRLWQSMQSMVRYSPLANCSGVVPSIVYSLTLPVRSVNLTHGMTWRCVSVAMYSTLFSMFMCQWMPAPAPSETRPPPTCNCSVVTVSELFSSSAYSRI